MIEKCPTAPVGWFANIANNCAAAVRSFSDSANRQTGAVDGFLMITKYPTGAVERFVNIAKRRTGAVGENFDPAKGRAGNVNLLEPSHLPPAASLPDRDVFLQAINRVGKEPETLTPVC
jgi:hypothetical protein